MIFESDDFVARFAPAGGGACCVVSFSPYTDEPHLDRPGFGEAFFRQIGIDSIFVINRTNVWFQYPEMPQALHAIRDLTQHYERTFTYGSSMGGYAAIRFAAAVGATTAIAISPQYSIDRQVVPFEKRWGSITRNIDFGVERLYTASERITPIIFYDPRDLDVAHFEFIRQKYPGSIGVRLPYAGHPAGTYLANVGLLPEAIASILDENFDARAFERDARKRRRQSGQYLFMLARRLPWRRRGAKLQLAKMAVDRGGGVGHLVYLALLLEIDGDLASAEQTYRRAISTLPHYPPTVRGLCGFLLRRGRAAEARQEANWLCAFDPGNSVYFGFLCCALFTMRDYGALSDALLERAVAGKAGPGALVVMWLQILRFLRLDHLCLALFRAPAMFHLHRSLSIILNKELGRYGPPPPRTRPASARREPPRGRGKADPSQVANAAPEQT